jgi:hypothetical protein
MWTKYVGDDKWDDMTGDISSSGYWNGAHGLFWSNELARSASWHLEDISGCPVYGPNVIDDGQTSDYLKQISTYERHKRVVIYPERF